MQSMASRGVWRHRGGLSEVGPNARRWRRARATSLLCTFAGSVIVIGLVIAPLASAGTYSYFGSITAASGQLFQSGFSTTSLTSPNYLYASGNSIAIWGGVNASAGLGTGGAGSAESIIFNVCASSILCTQTFTATQTNYDVSVTVAASFAVGTFQMSVSCNDPGSSAIAVASLALEVNVTDLTSGTYSGWGGASGPIGPATWTYTGTTAPTLTGNYSSYPLTTSAPMWSIWCGSSLGDNNATSVAMSPLPTGNFTASNFHTVVGNTYLVQYKTVLVAIAQVFNDPNSGTTASAGANFVLGAPPPPPSGYFEVIAPVSVW